MNTLGSIVGVALAALVLLPLLGLKWMLVAGAAIDVVLGLLAAGAERRGARDGRTASRRLDSRRRRVALLLFVAFATPTSTRGC